ncbi:copper resistance protein B [Sphingorhabdus sp.]|uniref:copper resistance protein B n=1 Tax=Sphingorhabdus sp. TaxID=1902408 RepID=UPI003982EB7A
MNYSLLLPAAALLATPALAQSGHQGHDMPAEKAEQSTSAPASDPHAGHDMGTADEAVKEQPAGDAADPHAGHDMSAGAAEMTPMDEVGNVPAPAPPGDHAADAIFGSDIMARSRKELAYEVGGMGYSLVTIDLLEVGVQKGSESYRFEGEAFTGGNINRFGIKFEGEGAFGERIDDLELQALYSRAIAPYWNLQAGVRYDLKPDPSRTYLVAGVEGIAPYWFKVNAAGFVSNKGEVRARLEASYDQRITQSLILQPRIEANVAFQDIRAIGVGSGLTDFEAGLRLRYEIEQEIAPYIGVEWRKQTGATARFSRVAGEDPETISLVAGIRIWF